MATQTWIPPLPQGFEARWDPNQRAYFFINHQTKQTTWKDPRFAPQPPAAPATQHHQAAQSLNQTGRRGRGHGGTGENVNMTTMYKQFGSTTTRTQDEDDEWEEWESDSETELPFSDTFGDRDLKVDVAKLHQLKQMYPSAPEDVIKSALLSNRNEVSLTSTELRVSGYKKEDEGGSHPPPRIADMLERLYAMFPNANKDLVSDLLRTCDNNENEARENLVSIGYTAMYPTTHQSSSRTSTPSKHTSPARAPSPARARSPARSASPKKATSPAKPKLSAAEKKKMEQKMKSLFKVTDDSVVKMACEVCNYDEPRAKAVLERMVEGESRPSTSRTRSPSPRGFSPTPTPTFSPSSLEPVEFSYDEPSPRPRPSTSSTRPGTNTSGLSIGSSRPGTSSSSRTAASSVSASSQISQQRRAKHVTHVVSPTVTHRHTTAGTFVSENRTPAKGPDPSLRVGPNKDLLLTDYTIAKGPNPELRQGPDASRVQGPQGAVGPDRSLYCGPQALLRQGPSPAGSPTRLIITAI